MSNESAPRRYSQSPESNPLGDRFWLVNYAKALSLARHGISESDLPYTSEITLSIEGQTVELPVGVKYPESVKEDMRRAHELIHTLEDSGELVFQGDYELGAAFEREEYTPLANGMQAAVLKINHLLDTES